MIETGFCKHVLTAGLLALAASWASPSRGGEIAESIGISAGNSGETKSYAVNKALINLADDLGLGWVRFSAGPQQWWNFNTNQPIPENFDTLVNYANARGIKIFIQIEFREDVLPAVLAGTKLEDFNWYQVGRSFAQRFGSQIEVYGMLNEVDHADSVEDPAIVAQTLEDFADGVRSVSTSYLVSTPSIGGTPQILSKANSFLTAIAPVINSGKVQVLNLHSYQDAKANQLSNILETGEWRPSQNFIDRKADNGITANVWKSAGEFNFRAWPGRADYDGTPDLQGAGFFTTMWDQTTTFGNGGRNDRRHLFAVPFHISNDENGQDGKRYRGFHMADDFTYHSNNGSGNGDGNGTYTWTPAAKGLAMRNILETTAGMNFVDSDPLGKGVAVMRGGGKKLWMWHNRDFFSNLNDPPFVEITGIPSNINSIKVLRWNSSISSPFKTITTNGATSVTVDAATYFPYGETYAIVAESANDGGTVGTLNRKTSAGGGGGDPPAGSGDGPTVGGPVAADSSADYRINFQPAGNALASGWTVDAGLTKRSQNGLNYGWTADHAGNALTRGNNSDPAINRSIVIVKRFADWNIDVSNGQYEVNVSIGDSLYGRASVNLDIEGVDAITDGAHDAGQYINVTRTVTVSDGSLTLDFGNGSGAASRINYLTIKAAGSSPDPDPTPDPDPDPTPGPDPDPDPDPPAGGGSPIVREGSSATQLVGCSITGTNINAFSANAKKNQFDNFRFENVSFGSGSYSQVQFSYATKANNFEFEVYKIDGSNWVLLATTTAPRTGNWSNFQTVTVNLSSALTGTETVLFRCINGVATFDKATFD
ncbi:MAG: carbohydrate-binding protein [Planctomycetota bacterium]